MTDSHPKGAPDAVRTATVPVARHRNGPPENAVDAVAVEEPLEICLGGQPLAVTMRTPGDDKDRARGFLLSEGILLGPHEIAGFEELESSRLSIQLQHGVEVDVDRFSRRMFVSSSCGICGKASIEAVRILARPTSSYQISKRVVAGLTESLERDQPTFASTGGLHAAGIFDIQGGRLAVREDVGRHNAVDKAIGAVAETCWPLPDSFLVVSGRQSFEIVQKAAVVGLGGVVGISAPSSLAVDLAESADLLLVGFARDGSFNVYSGRHRLRD